MKFLIDKIRLWRRFVSRITSNSNRNSEGSRPGSVGRGKLAEKQIKISVEAAKYLGRLSPELYEKVVTICRMDAKKQDNLITVGMVRKVVKSFFRNGYTGERKRVTNVRRQAG